MKLLQVLLGAALLFDVAMVAHHSAAQTSVAANQAVSLTDDNTVSPRLETLATPHY